MIVPTGCDHWANAHFSKDALSRSDLVTRYRCFTSSLVRTGCDDSVDDVGNDGVDNDGVAIVLIKLINTIN